MSILVIGNRHLRMLHRCRIIRRYLTQYFSHKLINFKEINLAFLISYFDCRGSALPTTISAKDDKCLWLDNKRFAVCGDFCVALDVEGAILSGLAAASKLSQVHNSL